MELMTPLAASLQLGVSVATVRQLAQKGELPCITTTTGRRLFRAEDIAALKERRRRREPVEASVMAAHA